MRFYKTRQLEMLTGVANVLRTEEQKIAKKVPALKDFIAEFIKRMKELESLRVNMVNKVKVKTGEKILARQAFMNAILNLIVVLKASGYRYKNQPLSEMKLREWQLKRMTAAKLCKTFQNVYTAVKKIKQLPYYGLTEADLQDTQAYYKEFTAVMKAPGQKKKEVAGMNKRLNDGITDCIHFLEDHIDSLMVIAAAEERDLKYSYKSARIIMYKGPGRPSDAEVSFRKSREKKGKEEK